MTPEEIENTERHHFRMGIKEGKHLFNWREYICGIITGILIGCLICAFRK